MSQVRFYLLRVLLYLGFSILLTWPLATKFSTHFVQGATYKRDPGWGHERGVQQLNIWTIWWNADRVRHGWSDYWEAPIFYPREDAFALSEPQPITMLLAPLEWLFPLSTVAYNVYLLISLTLNGLLAELLLRHMKVAWLPALYGGLMVAALPFVHWQRDVLQLIPIWGIIWLWLSLSRFAQRPTLRRGAVIGVAFSCILLSCLHYALFIVMVSLVACWWLVSDRLLNWRFWAGMGIAIVVACAICGPFIVPQIQVLDDKEDDWRRNVELVESLSAFPSDYLWVWQSTWHGAPPIDPPKRGYWNMSPGWLVMALALFAVAAHPVRWLLSKYRVPYAEIIEETSSPHPPPETDPPPAMPMPPPDDRPRGITRWLGMLVTVAVVSLILSFGAHLKGTVVEAWKPIDVHQFLVDYVPGYKQLRSPFRFGMLFQLAVMLLAALGIQVFWTWGVEALRQTFHREDRPTERQFWGQLAWTWVMLAAMGLSLFEVGWHSVPLGWVAGVTDKGWRQPGWVDWLVENTDEQDVIAHLPFPAGVELPNYEATTDAMFWQMTHRRRMVNGYSGFFPKTFFSARDMSYGFPAPGTLGEFKKLDVQWLVVSRWAYNVDQYGPQPFNVTGMRCVYSDEQAGVDIYQLE